MEKLQLTLACGDYDRTKALQDGAVRPEGIGLNYIPLQAEEIFYRILLKNPHRFFRFFGLGRCRISQSL